jgi:hypothetical protein
MSGDSIHGAAQCEQPLEPRGAESGGGGGNGGAIPSARGGGCGCPAAAAAAATTHGDLGEALHQARGVAVVGVAQPELAPAVGAAGEDREVLGEEDGVRVAARDELHLSHTIIESPCLGKCMHSDSITSRW